MPTYLCHGFRWQRRSIRVYVILQDLDDASPEWIIPAKSSQCILKSFYEVFEFLPYCSPKRGRYTPTRDAGSDDEEPVFNCSSTSSKDRSQSRGRGRSQSHSTGQGRSRSRPKQIQSLSSQPASDASSSTSSEDDFSAQSWSAVKLLEEYDPRDLTDVSRPYAYVADYAVRIDLSCSIVDEIARYEQQQLQSSHPAIPILSRNDPTEHPGWLEELRDQLQGGEEIRWYVIVNGDEVRDWPDEFSEHRSSSRTEQGYQCPQYQQYKQQPNQYQYQYPPQSHAPRGRPMPTRERRQHHAQYIHQQVIFEGADEQQKREQDQQPMPPEMGVQEPRPDHQQQQGLERDYQRQERDPSRGRERGKGQRLNGLDTNGKPPTVPEKDYYYFPRPPTAHANQKANITAPPLNGKPKVSPGTGRGGRPKTPGSKAGGLRRLFGRAKLEAG